MEQHILFKFIAQHLSYLATLDELQVSSMPDAGDHFLAPNNNLGDAKCFVFFTFYNLILVFKL